MIVEVIKTQLMIRVMMVLMEVVEEMVRMIFNNNLLDEFYIHLLI